MRSQGRMPPLEGSGQWLNSTPLTTADLAGHVVIVQFWTFTCINWLRTLSHVRAWAQKYGPAGAIVIGVHTPEFGFERDLTNVQRAVADLHVDYPVVTDNDFAIWTAFDNHYWPALYVVDATGVIRHHQFGEGHYDETERAVQRLLEDGDRADIPRDLEDPGGVGVEKAADWANLRTPETYLGYARGERFASPTTLRRDEQRGYELPADLPLNSWALGGHWTIGAEAVTLDEPDGRIAFRFHARDLHLILRATGSQSVPFQVMLDGQVPSSAQGRDIDEVGNGAVIHPRMYQLLRQPPPITDRRFEVTFLAPGVQAFAFTFG